MHWNDWTWTFPSAAISVHLQLWISKHRPEFTWMTILIGKNFYSHPFFYRWLSRSRRSQGSQDYVSVNPEFRSSEVLLSSHSVFQSHCEFCTAEDILLEICLGTAESLSFPHWYSETMTVRQAEMHLDLFLQRNVMLRGWAQCPSLEMDLARKACLLALALALPSWSWFCYVCTKWNSLEGCTLCTDRGGLCAWALPLWRAVELIASIGVCDWNEITALWEEVFSHPDVTWKEISIPFSLVLRWCHQK